MAEIAGSEFGQYQLLEKIAQGGMAEIFRGKARDSHGIEKPVVIKRILPQIAASPEFVDMLIDEAKIAVMLSHGNIAQIYDLGKVADDYFIVMEFVDGKTLSQIMKRLRTQHKLMPIASAVWICAEVARGLDYMHRKTDEAGNPLHIVHRDISPQNIILSTSGTVKIIDFGIAKAKTKISTTDSGILKGKYAYMSPEHAEGEKLNHQTDIFSLGIILFELLTGQRLFKGKNNPETIRKVKRTRVPLPSSLRPKIQDALDQTVLKALQRHREKRYQTAEELQRDLTKYLIAYHPQFSPRELVRYLGEVFPEIAPPISEESPTETKREEEAKEHEDTAVASPEVLRKHLEAEVSVPPPAEPEEKRSSLQLKPFIRPVLSSVTILILLGAGWAIKPWATRNLPLLLATLKTAIAPPAQQAIVELPTPVTPQEKPEGSLSIHSQPPGATIFLNDQKTEWKTPASIPFTAGQDQKVGLYLGRYRFWEKNLRVAAGKTATLNVSLELNYGDLAINSLPAEADLWLNGNRVGTTPFHLNQIPPETIYEVVIRRAGYEEWKRQLKIFGGKEEVINATLKKLPTKPLR